MIGDFAAPLSARPRSTPLSLAIRWAPALMVGMEGHVFRFGALSALDAPMVGLRYKCEA